MKKKLVLQDLQFSTLLALVLVIILHAHTHKNAMNFTGEESVLALSNVRAKQIIILFIFFPFFLVGSRWQQAQKLTADFSSHPQPQITASLRGSPYVPKPNVRYNPSSRYWIHSGDSDKWGVPDTTLVGAKTVASTIKGSSLFKDYSEVPLYGWDLHSSMSNKSTIQRILISIASFFLSLPTASCENSDVAWPGNRELLFHHHTPEQRLNTAAIRSGLSHSLRNKD